MGRPDEGRRDSAPKAKPSAAVEKPAAEPAAEPWTVGRLLQWTTEFLKAQGPTRPRLDAEVLLAESLGCRRIELYTAFDQTPTEAQRTAFRDLVRRRAMARRWPIWSAAASSIRSVFASGRPC